MSLCRIVYASHLYGLVLSVLLDELLGGALGVVGGVAVGHGGRGGLRVQVVKRVPAGGQHHTHLSQEPALELVLKHTHTHTHTQFRQA